MTSRQRQVSYAREGILQGSPKGGAQRASAGGRLREKGGAWGRCGSLESSHLPLCLFHLHVPESHPFINIRKKPLI